MMIPNQVYPYGPKLNLNSLLNNTISQSYNNLSITVSGTSGTNTLTASGTVTAIMFVGQEFKLNGTDTYTVSSLSGTSIVTTTNLITNYSSATVSSPTISSILDVSGNTNDATQSTVSDQPTYVKNWLNNRPAIGFNLGTPRLLCLTTPSITNIWSGGGSGLFVFNARSVGGGGGGRLIDKNSGWQFAFSTSGGNRLILTFVSDVANYIFRYSINYNTNYVLLITYNSLQPSIAPSFYLNSITSSSPVQTQGSGNVVSDSLGNLFIANNNTGIRGMDGYLATTMLFKGIPNSNQRRNLMKYLGNVYGISIS